jgi:hypothetical protein
MSSPVRVLEDGTRVYASGMKYKPVPAAERRNAVRRPEDPRAVRWYNEWIILVEVLPDEDRVWPETVPDSEAYEHWLVRRWCRCEICTRPSAKKWKERADRERGTKPEPLLDRE